ncbi:MAG: hypothetical protein ACI9CQ_002697, partial [Saprospiraceae bacterium]
RKPNTEDPKPNNLYYTKNNFPISFMEAII